MRIVCGGVLRQGAFKYDQLLPPQGLPLKHTRAIVERLFLIARQGQSVSA